MLQMKSNDMRGDRRRGNRMRGGQEGEGGQGCIARRAVAASLTSRTDRLDRFWCDWTKSLASMTAIGTRQMHGTQGCFVDKQDEESGDGGGVEKE